jgi:hypothetical protein
MCKPEILWAVLSPRPSRVATSQHRRPRRRGPTGPLPSNSSLFGGSNGERREPTERLKAASALAWLGLALLVSGAALAGETSPPPPKIQFVRTVVATSRAEGEPVSLTGHIRARTEESLAFRIDGHALRPDQKVRLLEDAQ